MEKKMEVSAIENGTVIDHIPADALFKIITILGLDRDNSQMITFGTNFPSKRMGRKAIIKIADRYCADDEINKIAILAPEASVNTIQNFKVTDKRIVQVPAQISGFVRCANPKCVTNNEPIETKFDIRTNAHGKASFLCRYCEKETTWDQAVLKK